VNFSHYLPATPKRIKRLRKICKGKIIAIMTPGASLYGLQERIEELKDYDILYASLNKNVIYEKYILSNINRNIKILMNSANPDFRIQEIMDFLERDDDNVFISERRNYIEKSGDNLLKLYNNYDEKLLFFTSINTWNERPNAEYPLHFLAQNSLSILILVALIAIPEAIVLFGADGGGDTKETSKLYWMNDSMEVHPDGLLPWQSLKRDIAWFNYYTTDIIERVRNLFETGDVPILNCSEKSLIDVFPKLSYDETIKYIKEYYDGTFGSNDSKQHSE